MTRATEGLIHQEAHMNPLFVGLIIIAIGFLLDNHWRNQERRQALEANDRFWNDLVNSHQKLIAEAYERGEPVRFTIERK
jgi:hypothetical protein